MSLNRTRKTRNPFAMFFKATPPAPVVPPDPDSEVQSITSDNDFPVTPGTMIANINGTPMLQSYKLNGQTVEDVIYNLRDLRSPSVQYEAYDGNEGVQGHLSIYDIYDGDLVKPATRPGTSKYRKYLCKTLLEFTRFASFVISLILLTILPLSSAEYSIRRYALNQTMELAIEETLLRSVLAHAHSVHHILERGETDPDGLEMMFQRARFTIDPSNSDTHRLWRELIVCIYRTSAQWQFLSQHMEMRRHSWKDYTGPVQSHSGLDKVKKSLTYVLRSELMCYVAELARCDIGIRLLRF